MWIPALRRPARVSIVVLAVAAACHSGSVTRPAAPPAEPARLTAVLINGGRDREINYQSHFLHLRQLRDLLLAAGLPPDRITTFSGDGPDPAADLATREVQPERDFWLVHDTRLGAALRTPITYVNSAIPGTELRPATRAALQTWFTTVGKQLGAGDTLLLYVTDHGTKNAEDLANNRITLWGKDETLSVTELRAQLATLDPAVRVVLLMSQCYSGSFANLAVPATDGVGGVCGYFASTADRPAYGCYPENRGRENVGHSFHTITALGRSGRFTDAHRAVLSADATPDVPNRTSDRYLEQLLRKAAGEGEGKLDALVDELVREAWQDKTSWEPDIRLLDEVGRAFGMFSPRSLAELDEQARALPALGQQLSGYGKAWRNGLADATGANLARFLAAHPSWLERIKPEHLTAQSQDETRALTADLLGQVGPFTRANAPAYARLKLFEKKSEGASATAYRMEVRLGVVLRLRALLTSIAGRVYLATRATPAERAAYEGLLACEDLRLETSPRPDLEVAAPEPFPSYTEDVRRVVEVVPAWMGINFRDANAAADKGDAEPGEVENPGAAKVVVVYPDSPAEAAGLQAGDVVLGPPDAPFTERNQIRMWTLTAPIDEASPLAIMRDGQRRVVSLTPRAFPLKWPSLPGPVQVGSRAPALKLAAYRGTLPPNLAGGSPHLLFFWATWCAPCKASLGDLLAYERSHGTPVIAITDEESATLDAFFKKFAAPFPATVALDEDRRTFLAFGVSGTPTFVLVDGGGIVRASSTGFEPSKGLKLPGEEPVRPAHH